MPKGVPEAFKGTEPEAVEVHQYKSLESRISSLNKRNDGLRAKIQANDAEVQGCQEVMAELVKSAKERAEQNGQ